MRTIPLLLLVVLVEAGCTHNTPYKGPARPGLEPQVMRFDEGGSAILTPFGYERWKALAQEHGEYFTPHITPETGIEKLENGTHRISPRSLQAMILMAQMEREGDTW